MSTMRELKEQAASRLSSLLTALAPDQQKSQMMEIEQALDLPFSPDQSDPDQFARDVLTDNADFPWVGRDALEQHPMEAESPLELVLGLMQASSE